MSSPAPPLAYRDDRGAWCSEGHRLFALAANWSAGAGQRPSLDVLAAQLREVGADVTPAAISAILNRRRAPSLALAGALERAFGVAAGAWSLAPGQLAVDRESSTGPRDVANIESREAPRTAAAE